MTVLRFQRREMMQGWQASEMNALLAACGDSLEKGSVSGYEIGVSESGDPQLYVLGPAPDCDCVLCISRLGRLYVLEDGQGRIILEHNAMAMLAKQVRGSLARNKAAIVARISVAWLAIKETFEERVEPALAEPVEVFSLVAPKLAALV